MRGFFGVGVEDISKPGNVGNLVRTTHAFGGSFFFFIKPNVDLSEVRVSDTAESSRHMPFYVHQSIAELKLPRHCRLVGVELTEDAVDLPSFRHPTQAAYILGPEKGSLSPEVIARCDHVVKIPTSFCVNVGVAGAIVLYDRMVCLGQYAERPVKPGGPLKAR
jgi:tRNA G18 (ribose-2'-O)-methylase SpoU